MTYQLRISSMSLWPDNPSQNVAGPHCVVLRFQVFQKENSNDVENTTADSSQNFITTATFLLGGLHFATLFQIEIYFFV